MSETVPPRKARITASPLQASPDYWLPRIQESYDEFEGTLRSSLAAAIKLGKRLIEAKERVGHGSFGRMFAGHDDPLPNCLPFTRQWAHRLTQIAGNEVISNVKHAGHLPPDLETIAELAVMKGADLGAAIESGRITPETTRAEAKQIKREFQEAELKEPDEKPRRQPAVRMRSDMDLIDDCVDTIEKALRVVLIPRPDLNATLAASLQVIMQGVTRGRFNS